MKYLSIWNWYGDEKSQRLESILDALGQLGEVKVEYFKGRHFVFRHLFGRKRTPSNKNENWNLVRIFYEGKHAIEIFDSDFGGYKGRFFDENFTESEIKEMEDVLKDAKTFFQKKYFARIWWIRALYLCCIVAGLTLILLEFQSGDNFLFYSSIFLTSGFILIFFRT
ncbi:MAG: hypothetical protein PVF58_21285 [Candidatus Methanofastidiosia archaeon]|jgi:hypothetical protein